MARAFFDVGSYVHVCNRGVRKIPIYRSESDFWRLLFNFYYLNHVEPARDNWKRELEKIGNPARFEWPEEWGQRKPIVSILAFSLMPNHLHLILKELVPGGVSKFMQRCTMAYAKYLNQKHGESGSLFQGTFRSRSISDDFDFRYAAVYVMVKNPFELYPAGLEAAILNFDAAWERAVESSFNSLADYAGKRQSPIISKDLLGELFETPDSFKEFARECMLYKLDQLEAISQKWRL